MSCHRCSSNFGIFRREYGCKHCGFSFCGKCCGNKIVIPGHDSKKKQLVCKTCYEKISSGKIEKDATSSPPLAFKKRLEAISSKPPLPQPHPHPQPARENAAECPDDNDQLLAARLDQVKRQRNLGYGVTQSELEERLAKLKGVDPKTYTAPPITVYREKDAHSDVKKAEDLVKQYQEEVKIDSKRLSAEEEIETRLAKLKGKEPPKKDVEDVVPELVAPAKEVSEQLTFEEIEKLIIKECEETEAIAKKQLTDLENDEQLQNEIAKLKTKSKEEKSEECEDLDEDEEAENMTNKIVEKFVAEAALEEACAKENVEKRTEHSESLESSEEEITDELPWCIICNENAQLRCIECEKDLFCLRCFKECHESFDMNDHKTIVYKPPPKQLI